MSKKPKMSKEEARRKGYTYCVKDKDYTPCENPRIEYTKKTNRKQSVCECPICGITKRMFIK